MALVLKINGSEVQYVKGTAFCSRVLGGRDSFRCSINSENQTYRIQQDDSVEFHQLGFPGPLDDFVLFKGLAMSPREHGIGGEGIPGITNQLNAQGLVALTDRRVITATIPAGTALDVILQTYVEPLLSPYGLSFDSVLMPGGPTIDEELVYKNRLLTEAVNEWTTLTGWVFRVDYNTDKFFMFEPGALIGFDINDQVDSLAIGDVEVERVTLRPANKIIVNAGSSASGAPQNVHDSFIAIAAQTTFPLRYQMAPGNILGWDHNGVIYVNGLQERVDTGGGTPDWTYDLATNSLVRTSGLSASDTVEFDYRAQMPFTVTATDPSWSIAPWEEVIDEPKVTSIAVAQGIADSILAVRQQKARNVFYTTHASGLDPGFFQVLNFVHRDVLMENCIVMESNFSDTIAAPGHDVTIPGSVNVELEYKITSQTGFLFQSTGLWRGVYRLWAKLGGSSGSAVALPPPGGFASAAPAPPVYSLQWDNFGIFGGEGYVNYYDLFWGAAGKRGLSFTGEPGEPGGSVGVNSPFRVEMGMLDVGGDFSIDGFGPGDRDNDIFPLSFLWNSPGDIFITAGTGAGDPTSYWGGIAMLGNDSLTDSYAAHGSFSSGGYSPGISIIPGAYGDSTAEYRGFSMFASMGLHYHPIDTIVASLPFTIDTDGVSDTQDFSTYVSTAGTGTLTLPPVGSTGSPNYHVWPVTGAGRIFWIANHSTGTLTVSGGGATINNASSIALGPYSAVKVLRFSDGSTGRWVILATHGTVSGGGGGTALTVPGSQYDVLFVGSGGVLDVDSGNFVYNKANGELLITRETGYQPLRLISDGGDVSGTMALYPGTDFADITFGFHRITGSPSEVADNADSPAHLFWVPGFVGGEIFVDGQTPGSSLDTSLKSKWQLGADGQFLVRSENQGTGATYGAGFYAVALAEGNGAPSWYGFEDKDGNDYYIWFGSDGQPRWGTGADFPEEDGTPSELGGNLFAGTATSLTALSADPASPADGEVWVRRSGTTPTRSLELRIRDGGTSYTMASITV